MKKLFVLIGLAVLFVSPLIGFAAEVTSPVSIINLSTDGSMSARNGTSTFLVNGSSEPLDIYAIKPNLGVFAIQVHQITPGALTASSNAGGTSPWQYSGVTYTINYSTSINAGTWSSGTTTIVGPIALSGQTTEVIQFTPELARFFRFKVIAGITQFAIKAKLIIQ